jgi:uncharacterized membrane protein
MDGNFIYNFFVKPIISPETQGYNLVNTSIYITLLIVACAVIYIILNKKIRFDTKFFVSIIPYILFGVSMRVLMHQIESGNLIIEGINKTATPFEVGFWFFTPGIWILTFLLVVIGLIISSVQTKIKYRRLFLFGLIISIPILLFNFLKFNNILAFLLTGAAIIIVSIALAKLIDKYTKYKILDDKLNLFIIMGQAIDGIASSVAIAFFGFTEQHVLSSIVLGANPLFFVILKLLLAVLICWSLDDYLKDNKHTKERANLIAFIKVIIAILGFATGLASLFKLGII